MCIKLSPEEGVVMQVVVKIYLVFPRASEGPLCILGTPRCNTFWLRLILHTLEDYHVSGGLCEDNNL